MGPTWGPPGSCRPQMGPMLASWTLLSGLIIPYYLFHVSIIVWVDGLHIRLDSLTHWCWVTHICVGNQTIFGSDNGLLPGQHQAIIWTIAGILLIGPLGTNFSEILLIQENACENVVRKMDILFRLQCVNSVRKIVVCVIPSPHRIARTGHLFNRVNQIMKYLHQNTLLSTLTFQPLPDVFKACWFWILIAFNIPSAVILDSNYTTQQ